MAVDHASNTLHGWQSSPNQRGTIDIIWTCASTLLVAVWVMMHLNLPSRNESLLKVSLRKAKWLVLALLAPELVMLFASGQWASAKRSVSDMKTSGVREWTMVHAFYADSGGFVLQTTDSPGFPVTAKQMHWLVAGDHLKMPEITKEEIWDKSKADFFAKAVACLQVGWFVVQIIVRAAAGLPMTLLELSTLALLTCSGATFFFWFFKPLDVSTPTVLKIEKSLADILSKEAATTTQSWKDTPLDFIEPLAYTSGQLPFSKLWTISERPLPRIPNDRDSWLHDLRTVIVVAIPTAAFGSFHLIGWNFAFPTRIEQQLWRWSCLGGGIVLGIGCTAEAASIIWNGYSTTGLTNLGGYKLKWPTNIMFFVPGFLYVTGRLIVIVEVVITLRALPAGCFQTPDWTQVFPHVG